MNDFIVDRYLCPDGKIQYLDTFSFLTGEISFASPNPTRTMNAYKQFKDIRNNPYNFIVGNGGLGKSTYLKQIKTALDKENIPSLLIELKSLSDENSLYNRIEAFLRKLNFKEVYLLLDAVDEAIDCNIQNIANKISDAIFQILESCKIKQKLRILNKDALNNIKKKKRTKFYRKIAKNFNSRRKIKTIITCRDNRIPVELVPNLKKIYETNDNNVFYLCRLTEEDAKNIANHLGCKNADDFLNKVRKYNLGSFASSPITLKPLVEMHKNKEINNRSNNYDIYEILMRHWCEESEYRKNKALNNEDSFLLKPTDEILFIASKIAIELKLSCKNKLSYNEDHDAILVENFYDLFFDLPCGKKIIFTKELVDYTLKTKIFNKIDDKFYIEQQTYIDFLVARYLYNMRASEKELFKILKIKKEFHPSFTESLAYLAVKNKKVFKSALKEIPERILLSSVFFCDDKQKEELLKAYLKCAKNGTINFWDYSPGRVFFNKKLYYTKINNLLKHKIKTANKDVKETIIDIIWDNHLEGFNAEFRNMIFNPSENPRIKTLVIRASYDCQYSDVINEIAKNLHKFSEEINNDKNDQLRGALLNCLYPKNISDETMLGYIKEPQNADFYGHYLDFIRHKFSKFVNKDNAGLFLDWIKEHRDMKVIVSNRYGEGFSNATKEIIKQISEVLNFDLITKYINLLLTEKFIWNIVPDDIINKILSNNEYRLFFINQLIEKIPKIQDFKTLVGCLPKPPINTLELPVYLNMYIDKKDDFRKEMTAFLIENAFRDFLDNNLTNDIDEIYELICSNEELEHKFGYFINPVSLDPATLEPIDEYGIAAKRHYYSNQKNKEKENEQLQQIKELNNINKQTEIILYNFEKDKNAENCIRQLFNLMNLENNSTYYQYRISIVLDKHSRWKDISEDKQLKIIDIFKGFLLRAPTGMNIENCIYENKYDISWNCLSILPLFKNTDIENYNKILQNWADVIVYFRTDVEAELNLKQELIMDLYNLNAELVHNGVSKIINKTPGCLPYNFLKSLEFVWNEKFANQLFICATSENLNDEIKLELIQALACHQYEPIEKYIKNYIKELLNTEKINNDKIGNLLSMLFCGFKNKVWRYIKKLIYNNKISKEIFLIFINKTSNQNIYTLEPLHKILNSSEVIELYKWIIKKYPHINQFEYKSGTVNDRNLLKDFTDQIFNYFITSGNVDAYKKIKKAYLKNRKNKNNYKKSYNRNLNLTKYNHLQNIKINNDMLNKLENLYYKEKKAWSFMKNEKNFFGNNNTININENCNNKNLNIGGKGILGLIIFVIAIFLFLRGKITFLEFLNFIP